MAEWDDTPISEFARSPRTEIAENLLECSALFYILTSLESVTQQGQQATEQFQQLASATYMAEGGGPTEGDMLDIREMKLENFKKMHTQGFGVALRERGYYCAAWQKKVVEAVAVGTVDPNEIDRLVGIGDRVGLRRLVDSWVVAPTAPDLRDGAIGSSRAEFGEMIDAAFGRWRETGYVTPGSIKQQLRDQILQERE